jgi:hypothetical protein
MWRSGHLKAGTAVADINLVHQQTVGRQGPARFEQLPYGFIKGRLFAVPRKKKWGASCAPINYPRRQK